VRRRPLGTLATGALLLSLAGCRHAAPAAPATAADRSATPAAGTSDAAATAQAGEVSMAEETATMDAWRQKRIARLEAPDGWLTLVGLEWLEEGRNQLGSSEQAEVRFPAKAPAAIGTITRQGKELTLEPAPGVSLRVGDQVVSGPTRLVSDADGEPTTVTLGSLSFFVIERGDRYAVRIKDSESPVRAAFTGIDMYPVSPQWRVRARFEPAPAGSTMPVPNILGTVEPAAFPGTVVFTRDGHEVRLRAIDEGDGKLFLVFGDATNGKGTYGGGRFVYADPPKPGEDTVVVDFNQAYNPPCVFTPYATCPLPPQGNKLPFAVEAGEKLWAGYDAAHATHG
jgi:uncharacterized protein (DUF1684 family)